MRDDSSKAIAFSIFNRKVVCSAHYYFNLEWTAASSQLYCTSYGSTSSSVVAEDYSCEGRATVCLHANFERTGEEELH